jgi:PAS domain S-box-containing protein
VGLFVVDDKMKIVEFNAAAEKLTGWLRDEVIGKQCSEVLQSSLCEAKCPLIRSAQQKKALRGQEAFIMTKWGEKIPIFFSSSALLNEDGQMVAGIEIFRDAAEIKKLEAQKRNFISVFAHDLKAPVSISGGFLERLLQGKAGDLTEKQRNYITAIEKEILRLENYIHYFLDISRIEAGQIQLSFTLCNLEDILHELVAGFQVRASEKNIVVILDVPEKLPMVSVDKIQIERVISNLLDNAIKYSSSNGKILLRVWSDRNYIFIETRDQGLGISEENLPHVFDYFYRVETGSDRRYGVGLGLAAVKAIIEAHGGKVWVKSEKGIGSSFFVKIPQKRFR